MGHLVDAIIETWFGDWADHQPLPDDAPQLRLWWGADPEIDARLRARFGEAHAQACAGELDALTATPRGTLALVLLLDQLSRNLHRGTARAFAADDKARAVVRDALARGVDAELEPVQRQFLYMPLMHSESLEDHDALLPLVEALVDDTRDCARAGSYANCLAAARQHRDIVARFGRYPYRNAVLGRATTDAEAEWMASSGVDFGQGRGEA